MKILMVRHGEIPSNINRVYAGKSSEKLTEKGLCQAKAVSDILKNYNVNALYSSPMRRTLQTSLIISRNIGVKIKVEKAFKEMVLGAWEGLSEEIISQLYPKEWHIWQTSPEKLNLSGRETLSELLTRVLTGVRNIYLNMSNSTIVIITHVAVIRVMKLWNVQKSLCLYKTIHVPNAKIFEINIDTCPNPVL
jgi:broad specificity phosphatase PhoE